MSKFPDLYLAALRAEACADAADARGHEREAAYFFGRSEGLRAAIAIWLSVEQCPSCGAKSAHVTPERR